MMLPMPSRKASENWNSKLGVILAVAGSAIGFGNFLRFPGLAAQYGGGAFMIAYFTAFLLLGIPLSWVEWTLGRRGGVYGAHSTASIFYQITHSHAWKYLGIFAVLAPLSISMYYMYLEGWTLGYAYHMAAGDLNLSSTEEFSAFFSRFVGASHNGAVFEPGQSTLLIFFALALLLNLYLVYRGVTKGIEWFCKWSIPVLLLTAIIVMVRVLTLGTPDATHPERNVNEGLGYMWNPAKTMLVTVSEQDGVRMEKTVNMVPHTATPEQRREIIARTQEAYPQARVEERRISLGRSLMNPQLWITAAGQIFFSLSIGFGTICTYASYVPRGHDIALGSMTANAANEVVEVGIAGMMIVPATVSLLGVAAAAGASTFGLGFNVLPQVFAGMPGGQFFGTLFFALLSLAAVTSSISLLQPAMAFMEEFWNLRRTQSTTLVALLMTGGALIVSWFTGDGMMALDTMDFWIGTMFLYIITTMYLVIFRFIWGTKNGLRELQRGALLPIPRALGFVLNWVTPLILFAIFASWVYQNAFVTLCPQIRNILNAEPGALVPLAWVFLTGVFMAFVVRTSRYLHKRKLEKQSDRIPIS